MSQNQSEYVTTTEAIQLLDVSKGKMAKLIKTGEIPYISDPRNERAKLIKRTDIEAWLAKTLRPKVPHRRKVTTARNEVFQQPGTFPSPGPDDDDE